MTRFSTAIDHVPSHRPEDSTTSVGEDETSANVAPPAWIRIVDAPTLAPVDDNLDDDRFQAGGATFALVSSSATHSAILDGN